MKLSLIAGAAVATLLLSGAVYADQTLNLTAEIPAWQLATGDNYWRPSDSAPYTPTPGQHKLHNDPSYTAYYHSDPVVIARNGSFNNGGSQVYNVNLMPVADTAPEYIAGSPIYQQSSFNGMPLPLRY